MLSSYTKYSFPYAWSDGYYLDTLKISARQIIELSTYLWFVYLIFFFNPLRVQVICLFISAEILDEGGMCKAILWPIRNKKETSSNVSGFSTQGTSIFASCTQKCDWKYSGWPPRGWEIQRDQNCCVSKQDSCRTGPAHAHTLDCNSTRHSEALYRMELTLGIQLYWLRKSVWQRGRETLWKLLIHCGTPVKFDYLIIIFLVSVTQNAVHSGQIRTLLCGETGIRQGCLLSPLPYLPRTDWQTRTLIEKLFPANAAGTATDNLDFAENVAVLSQSHKDMLEKTYNMETAQE